MSQSDYIKYKQIITKLKTDNNSTKMSSVFDSQNYTNYKQYAMEKSITNTKPIYNKLTPTGKQVIFGMERTVSSCPTFIICNNTNTRPNRIPMTSNYFSPVPRTIKDVKNANNLCNACKCIQNSKYTNSNICSCKTGDFGIVR